MKFELVGKQFDNFFTKSMKLFDNLSFPTIVTPTFDFDLDSKMNLKEEDDKFILEIAAENFEKKNIKIKANANSIKITMVLNQKDEDGKVKRMTSNFTHSIPQNVDIKNIKAKIKENTLIITLPKN